jgi:hypothetical protein
MQKNLAEKIAAEYGQYEEESTLQLDAMGGGEPAGPRTIQVQVACMSRAGREPGYKKTNQDNCFAFEKFIGEDQSLFGAMDGHGPHGAQPPHSSTQQHHQQQQKHREKLLTPDSWCSLAGGICRQPGPEGVQQRQSTRHS